MARGQSQRSSTSVRSELRSNEVSPFNEGLRKALSNNAIRAIDRFSVIENYNRPTKEDGNNNDIIDRGRIMFAIKNLGFGKGYLNIGADKSEAAGIITDILEMRYLQNAKIHTLTASEVTGENTPALTRVIRDRYEPKIEELQSSIKDGFKNISKSSAKIVEKALDSIFMKIEMDRGSDQNSNDKVGAYKQGDVKKLFNDIYDTLNS